MDADSFFVEAQDDTGEDRTYVTCNKCPGEDEGRPCSRKSFKACSAWSFVSEDVARERLKQHLMHSSYHRFSDEKAGELSLAAEFEDVVETQADREYYRNEILRIRNAKAAEEAAAAAAPAADEGSEWWDEEAAAEPDDVPGPPIKAKGKGLGKKGKSKGKVKGKTKAKGGGGKGGKHPGGTPAIGAAPPPRRALQNGDNEGENDTCEVSIAKLQVIADSILRMKNAASGMRNIAMQAASRAQELATAFQAGAQQFQQEMTVLTASENTIRAILRGEDEAPLLAMPLTISPF